MNAAANPPWYRQFWPWFLIVLPGAVVVAGLSTVAISMKHADNLVADDYYKEGLAINQRLSQDRRAAESNISAAIDFASGGSILLELSGNTVSWPDHVQLLLQHPTSQELDHSVVLSRESQRGYRVDVDTLVQGRWYLTLQSVGLPEAESWRLKGEVDLSSRRDALLVSRIGG